LRLYLFIHINICKERCSNRIRKHVFIKFIDNCTDSCLPT
jgi:hypothetical protein